MLKSLSNVHQHFHPQNFEIMAKAEAIPFFFNICMLKHLLLKIYIFPYLNDVYEKSCHWDFNANMYIMYVLPTHTEYSKLQTGIFNCFSWWEFNNAGTIVLMNNSQHSLVNNFSINSKANESFFHQKYFLQKFGLRNMDKEYHKYRMWSLMLSDETKL